MFRIADGREHFYQWDVDRQIIVEDNSITEVHFCNRTDDCSLVVDVVDGLANVPNVILQKSFDIRVFGFDGKATRYDEAFKVKARTKPTDYVYTEVEIKRYEDLSKRLDEIEEKGFSEEVVDNAVIDYFEKNPIDFTGYATEEYVDKAIEAIPEVDLSKHALKSEIPTKVSQLQNDSKFITREEVPQQDLSEYAKKSEIPDVSKFLTSVPSEYITESELASKNYLTSVPSHYITESNLNSRNYLTEVPSEYVTEGELNAKGYVTGGYVDDAIAQAQLSGGEIDLSEYAKKSDIPDVSDFISEIPSEYITESELDAKKYITELNAKRLGWNIKEGTTLLARTLITDFEISGTNTEAQAVERLITRGIIKWTGTETIYLSATAYATYGAQIKNWYKVDETGTVTDITQEKDSYYLRPNVVYLSYSYEMYEFETEEVFRAALKGSVDLNNYYTKEEVDEAIANIDIPEGGEGAGKTILALKNGTLPEDTLTLLQEVQTYGLNNDILGKYDITYFDGYKSYTAVYAYAWSDLLYLLIFDGTTRMMLTWRTGRTVISNSTTDTLITSGNISGYLPETPSPSGGGGNVYILPEESYTSNDAAKQAIGDLARYYHENNKTLPPNTYYMFNWSYEELYLVDRIYFSTFNGGGSIDLTYSDHYGARQKLYCYVDGNYNVTDWYISTAEGGSGGWIYTSDTYDSSMYAAKELYIRIAAYSPNSGGYKDCFSYIKFGPEDQLNNHTMQEFTFTTHEGLDYSTPYWFYDGSSISIQGLDGYNDLFIAYKL